jgi:hypothetical protein
VDGTRKRRGDHDIEGELDMKLIMVGVFLLVASRAGAD